jgi:caprin-1
VYREKLRKGEKLDKDQKEAADKYESVIANIEFGRELLQMYQTMSDEADKLAEKASKKQAKKEKIERQQQEVERLSDVLKLQTFLNSLDADELRADLLSGKYGGVTLTEDNLAQFDDFYQVVCPTADNESSLTDQIASATDHLISYVERSDKPVVDTSYHNLHTVIDKLVETDFFDKYSSAVFTTEVNSQLAADDNAVTEQDAEIKPCEDSIETAETVVGEPISESAMSSYEAVSTTKSWTASSQQKPITNIVTSMQGSYNFLQDSEIDVDPSFEPVDFMTQPEHSYTFVNQTHDVDGGFLQHQQTAIQEPGFVIVGYDNGQDNFTYSG